MRIALGKKYIPFLLYNLMARISIADKMKRKVSLWEATRSLRTSYKVFMDVAKVLGVKPVRRGNVTLFDTADVRKIRAALKKYR